MPREISGSTKSVPLPLFLSIYTDDYVYMCEFSYWANESVFRWMWMGGWKPLLLIRRLVKALLQPTKVPPVHSSVFCPSQIFSFHLLLIFWGVWGVGGRPCGLDWFQGFDFNTSDLMIRTKPRVLDWTRYSFSFCFSEFHYMIFAWSMTVSSEVIWTHEMTRRFLCSSLMNYFKKNLNFLFLTSDCGIYISEDQNLW